MKLLISALLIIHGLIAAGQAAGSFGSIIPAELRNPSFVSWWPITMGRSWLFSWLGLENSLAVYRIGGLLWLAGGIALVAAGLGILGFVIPVDWLRCRLPLHADYLCASYPDLRDNLQSCRFSCATMVTLATNKPCEIGIAVTKFDQ